MIATITITIHSLVAIIGLLVVAGFAIGFAIGYRSGNRDCEKEINDEFLKDD